MIHRKPSALGRSPVSGARPLHASLETELFKLPIKVGLEHQPTGGITLTVEDSGQQVKPDFGFGEIRLTLDQKQYSSGVLRFEEATPAAFVARLEEQLSADASLSTTVESFVRGEFPTVIEGVRLRVQRR